MLGPRIIIDSILPLKGLCSVSRISMVSLQPVRPVSKADRNWILFRRIVQCVTSVNENPAWPNQN